MTTVTQINEHCFSVVKGHWTHEHLMTAESVGLTVANSSTLTGDVRKVWPDALHKFLWHCCTDLFAQKNKSYKEAVMMMFRNMYKSYRGYLKDSFFPRINYARPLYKHQENALVNMLPHQFNFLSFDMGMGKTITSATLSKILNVRRTIIIAPAGVKWNWYHDMTDDWGYDPLYWTILDRQRSKCIFGFAERFVVVNYEMISKPWVWHHLTKSEVGHIIIDEVHLAKNHKTKRYKNVEKLVQFFPKARVTMLSGTPITNRINDMFAYFKLAQHPLGKNESFFKRRYLDRSNGDRGKIVGAKNIEELTVRNSNFMIRKKAEECLDLPKLIINKYYLEDTEITDEYKEVLAEMYKTKMALSEAGNAKTVGQLEMQMDSNVHSLNRILATAKAKRIAELVEKIHSEGRKVIVFSTYKAALSALESIFVDNCVKIDGSVDSHKRSVLIEKFKKDPDCFLFLGNMKAAGVGINLVNASDVIFMNFPFTPDDLEQPQKRAHRIGQKRPVNAYYTIVKNSIDEHIYNLIVDKSEDINYVLDKGKKGVVHYGQVMSKLFKTLINQYAEDNNMKKIVESEFEEV